MSSNAFSAPQFPINRNLDPETFTFAGNPAVNRQYDYEWIFIVAILAAFLDAYGIGANDVANAFSPSVGSKTLKLWQAVVMATFCEFGGALLLGARVTDTIRSKIVSPSTFKNNDDLLMLGMFIADLSSGTWLLIATKLELPVSTTHAIIGAIIGFSLVSPAGGNAVNWQSVGMIVLSWFTSPILSGIIAASLFALVRKFVLRSENSFERALKFYPILLAFTISVNLSFILTKSAISNGFIKGLDGGEAVGVSVAVGVGVGIISYFTFIRVMRRRYEGYPDVEPTSTEIEQAGKTEDDDQKSLSKEQKLNKMLSGGGDIHGSIATNERVGAIHKNAEVFPYRTECVLALLQVVTACANSFAHGANDVANAIGPLSSVAAIYESGSVAKSKVEVPIWILALGGAGIVIGLITYGYKIMAAMGVKMTKITPSRGFAIELGASLVIIVGSFLGIPLSTTHCAVGAIVGVGMTEGIKTGVNWRLLGPVFFGWIVTIVFAGLVSAGLMALMTFSPSQYYPVSFQNCLFIFGQLYNGTATGYTGNVQVPQKNGMVSIIAGFPSTGEEVDIFAYNP